MDRETGLPPGYARTLSRAYSQSVHETPPVLPKYDPETRRFDSSNAPFQIQSSSLYNWRGDATPQTIPNTGFTPTAELKTLRASIGPELERFHHALLYKSDPREHLSDGVKHSLGIFLINLGANGKKTFMGEKWLRTTWECNPVTEIWKLALRRTDNCWAPRRIKREIEVSHTGTNESSYIRVLAAKFRPMLKMDRGTWCLGSGVTLKGERGSEYPVLGDFIFHDVDWLSKSEITVPRSSRQKLPVASPLSKGVPFHTWSICVNYTVDLLESADPVKLRSHIGSITARSGGPSTFNGIGYVLFIPCVIGISLAMEKERDFDLEYRERNTPLWFLDQVCHTLEGLYELFRVIFLEGDEEEWFILLFWAAVSTISDRNPTSEDWRKLRDEFDYNLPERPSNRSEPERAGVREYLDKLRKRKDERSTSGDAASSSTRA